MTVGTEDCKLHERQAIADVVLTGIQDMVQLREMPKIFILLGYMFHCLHEINRPQVADVKRATLSEPHNNWKYLVSSTAHQNLAYTVQRLQSGEAPITTSSAAATMLNSTSLQIRLSLCSASP